MALFKYKLDTVNNYYAFLNEVTGDDANDGLTPETAVASMNRLVTILNTYAGALRRVGVIYAHRIYNQAITVTRTSTKPITFDFVNKTVIESSTNNIKLSVNGDAIYNVVCNYNLNLNVAGLITHTNCIFNGNGSQILGYDALGGGRGVNRFDFCIINGFDLRGRIDTTRFIGFGMLLNNCVINNCKSGIADIGNSTYRVFNSIITNSSNLDFATANSAIEYSNIVGTVKWGGVAKDNSGLQSLGINLNGTSINPQFNDPTNGVYTVRSTSPMLYRGENGQHIGIGEAIYVSATELFSLGETIDNLTLQSGKLIRPDDSSDALLETYMMSLGATRSIERISLVAALAYATSGITRSVAIDTEGYIAYDSGATYHTGSSITDSSIKYKSIADNNTGNTPATSPLYWERMTWESGVSYPSGKIIQYTDNKWYRANAATSTTWVAGEWDLIAPVCTLNFGLKYGRTNSEAEAMDWEMFNFNQELLVDASGNGTANNDYDPDTGASIRINYWKVRIMVKTVR